jgi:hypothetical protein
MCQRPAIVLAHDPQVTAPQTLPHEPQLLWSLVVSMQVLPQCMPVAQPQLLEMQLSPPATLQVVPQLPQL